MRRRLYPLYLRLMKLNVDLRQRAFALYLSRRKARLEDADLSYLDLRGVNLAHANLRGANLSFCDLRGVTLDGADLTGANLRGALVTDAQLSAAASLEGATLPEGFPVSPAAESRLH